MTDGQQMRFQGKSVIVTGAGRNIGRSIAMAFADEGARLILVDRSGRSEGVARLIKERGGEALAVRADLTIEKDVERLIAQTVSTFESPDVVINNAAGTLRKGLLETSAGELKAVFDSCVLTAFLCTQYAASAMIEAGVRGAIVNIASTSGHRGPKGRLAYSVAKAALLNFTRAAAADLMEHGIRVNSVSPTQSGTPVGGTENARRSGSGQTTRVPMGRFGRPEDQAAAALFLSSPDASFITGADLACDGGLLSGYPRAF